MGELSAKGEGGGMTLEFSLVGALLLSGVVGAAREVLLRPARRTGERLRRLEGEAAMGGDRGENSEWLSWGEPLEAERSLCVGDFLLRERGALGE